MWELPSQGRFSLQHLPRNKQTSVIFNSFICKLCAMWISQLSSTATITQDRQNQQSKRSKIGKKRERKYRETTKGASTHELCSTAETLQTSKESSCSSILCSLLYDETGVCNVTMWSCNAMFWWDVNCHCTTDGENVNWEWITRAGNLFLSEQDFSRITK